MLFVWDILLEKNYHLGEVKKLAINNFEFEHNILTEKGSAGSPIILFNTLKVIGIHKHGYLSKNINVGTFIGKIFNEINNDLNKGNNNFNKKEDSSQKIIFNENNNDKPVEK